MNSIEKILISQKEHCALMDIRGMPDSVHSMVYSSKMEKDKHVLTGADEAFEELLSLISEEIGEGLCPQKNISLLLKICKRIDPESLDWIGE
jgi:adenosyl cobinamide kinase/adenosyl cobinamide phosphate guanylyltransferase